MTEQEAVSGLFSATPLPMFVLDAAAGRVLAANEAALDRYGLEPAMVPGLDPRASCPRRWGARFRHWAEAGDGSPTEAFEQRTADGVSFAAELRVTRLRWGGEEARLLIVRDVSARMRNEERLRQAQKMEAIGRLAGGDRARLQQPADRDRRLRRAAARRAAAGRPDARDDAGEIAQAADAGRRLTRAAAGVQRRKHVAAAACSTSTSPSRTARMLLERLLGEDVAARRSASSRSPATCAPTAGSSSRCCSTWRSTPATRCPTAALLIDDRASRAGPRHAARAARPRRPGRYVAARPWPTPGAA